VEYRQVAYIIPPPPDADDNSTKEEGNVTNNNQSVYKWDTERALSQAVIPGDRLAKVEIARTEWEGRVVG